MKYLDSRELQERFEELEGLRDALNEAREERENVGSLPNSTQEEIDKADKAVQNAEVDYSEDEANELAELESLRDEVGNEWRYGVTFIPESEFENYARDYAEDVGAIQKDAQWPACHINWTAAAESLKMDFSSTTYQGSEYWYRA